MKKICLLFIIYIMFTMSVSAASNPYKKEGPYGVNCTWYAWNKAKEKANVTLPGLGDAKNWYKNAKNAGYSVGTTAKANSIIVWGDWTSYGHVGYVEKIDGDKIFVWSSVECIDREDPAFVDCIMNGVSEETDKVCVANAKRIPCEYSLSQSDYKITGYIYLNETPKVETNVTNQKEETKVETKKSNNNYLTDIKIDGMSIEFDKNNNYYSISMGDSHEKINIEATLEDKKATIIGTGLYNLNFGRNEIVLTVIAEDKSERKYTLNISRLEPPIVNNDNEEKLNKLEGNNKNYYYKIGLFCGIFLIFIGFIFLINKKRK